MRNARPSDCKFCFCYSERSVCRAACMPLPLPPPPPVGLAVCLSCTHTHTHTHPACHYPQELDKTHGGAAMQLVLGSRPSSRCLTVPQLFAGGAFIGGCSDALVLHAEGRLEPLLRKAAGEVLVGGETSLPPPVDDRACSPEHSLLTGRPMLNRSLSA